MTVKNIYELHSLFLECGSVTTDSRAVKDGDMFFALKGDRFDGNAFAAKALESGASYAVVSDPSLDGDRFIVVEDTLATLQALARTHRAMLSVSSGSFSTLPVIALTGTNGKTTTKELIKAVLSAKYNVLATEGNLNNHIGVPLTLLRLKPENDMAVIEMGASAPGEIMSLARIALPNFGLITNVGKAHLAGFGSFDGVKRTKGELYDYIQRTADKVFVNVDNPELVGMASLRPDLDIIPYGLKYSGASVCGTDSSNPYLRIRLSDGRVVETSLVGAYNADNVEAALAVGKYFGVSEEDAISAVSSYVPSNSRSQMEHYGSNVYIIDAYNANPTSMSAALDNISGMESPKKAVMLGDMLELGDDSFAEHVNVIRKVLEMNPSFAYFVGSEFGAAINDPEIRSMIAVADGDFRHFDSSDALASYLDEHPFEDSLVLVKGSRGTRMEKTLRMVQK